MFFFNCFRLCCLCLAFCFAFCQVLDAQYIAAEEIIELANGSTISGKILNPGESPRKTWQVQPAKGITIELPHRDSVTRIPMQTEAVAQYFEQVPFFAESVENHLKLAAVCNNLKLHDLGKLHYERVLELDPDNETARQALNHRKIDGEWVSYEEEMLRRGYVKTSRGNWTTPQKLKIDEGLANRGQENKETSKNAREIIAIIKSADQKEIEQILHNADSSEVVSALAKELKIERNSELRDNYVRILSQMGTSAAFYEISHWAMQEPDEEVCWTCIVMMRNMPGLSKYIIPYLSNRDNITVNRAAYILGQLGDRAAVPALIDVLVTEHRVEVNRIDPNLSRYTGTGNNSFAGGQSLKPETATELVSNREVLTALETLTGENFRYDIPAWTAWWQSQNRVTEFDARRGSYD